MPELEQTPRNMKSAFATLAVVAALTILIVALLTGFKTPSAKSDAVLQARHTHSTNGYLTGFYGIIGGPLELIDGHFTTPGFRASTNSSGVVTASGRSGSYSVAIASNGSFRLTLPPGIYQATGKLSGFQNGCGSSTVTVRANHTTTVKIACPVP
jgi:hypothetical protein